MTGFGCDGSHIAARQRDRPRPGVRGAVRPRSQRGTSAAAACATAAGGSTSTAVPSGVFRWTARASPGSRPAACVSHTARGGTGSPSPPTSSRIDSAAPRASAAQYAVELVRLLDHVLEPVGGADGQADALPGLRAVERVVELLEERLLGVGRVARVAAAQPHAAVGDRVEQPVLPRLHARAAATRADADQPHAVAFDRDDRRGQARTRRRR